MEIVEADVLRVDLPALVAAKSADKLLLAAEAADEGHAAVPQGSGVDANQWSLGRLGVGGKLVPAQIVGNLTYYITSDILLQLFRASRAAPGVFGSAVVMMQREVAERVAAVHGGRDFGLLSATAQMHARAEILFTLGPESFSPPPAVDSSVLRLRFAPRFEELGVEPAAFDRFLHQAFAQKRKTLGKNLRQAGFAPEALTRAWPEGLEVQVRAEATSLEDLAALHRVLAARSNQGASAGV